MRVRLAIEIRTSQLASGSKAADRETIARNEPSPLWRSRCRGKRLEISPSHDEFPAMLAEALDMIEMCDFDVSESAGRLGVSSSQLVRLLRHEPAALGHVNSARNQRGLRLLR